MPSDRPNVPLHPSLLIGAWAEALLSSRRVAILGDSSSGLAELVASTASRRVHAYDPDKSRLASTLAAAASGDGAAVSYASVDDLDGRTGAFDAVVLDDLGAFADAAEIIGTARALLSSRGFLLLVCANPDQLADTTGSKPLGSPLGYYDLYDLVAASFEHVRMLGQAPFVGVAVAEFAAAGEPNVTIDTSLTSGAEEPFKFVVVASDHEMSIEPYTLVQGPAGDALRWLGTDQQAGPSDRELQEGRHRLADAQSQLDQLQQRAESSKRLANERKALATQLSAKLSELQVELEHHRKSGLAEREGLQRRIADLERRLRQGEQRLEGQVRERLKAALDREARAHEEALERAEEAHQEDLDRMLDRIAELEDEKEAAEQARDKIVADAAAAVAAHNDTAATDAEAVRGYEIQIGELRQAITAAQSELEAARRDAKDATELKQSLQLALQERDAAQTRADELAATGGGQERDEKSGEDLGRLEERLRGRGQLIRRLERELSESQRIGRELVHRFGPNLVATLGGASETHAADNGMAARLEGLLRRCSQYEADLQLARWQIAALAGETDKQSEQPADDQEKLEQALRRAHEELALLKRRLADQRQQ